MASTARELAVSRRLEVYTRDAMTQNNLALALLALGNRESSASQLHQARSAVVGAIKVDPNDADFRDTLEQIDAATSAMGAAQNFRRILEG